MQQKLCYKLAEYGFPLRKWKSNSIKVLQSINEEKSQENIQLKFEVTHKALGIYWNPNEDCFLFKITQTDIPSKFTKRNLASNVMKLFDPLGWLAPVIITAKILLQNGWLLSDVGWDDTLPPNITKAWTNLQADLNSCQEIKIPRWLQYSEQATRCSVNGFSDASVKAYAAVLYFVVEEAGIITSTLIAAKTRVAPKQNVSLPRLELCGAVLLAELAETVIAALQIPHLERYMWTDSTIVLAWIASPSNRWKTYVANRVARIHELSKPNQWRHVNSERNSADCASRGISLRTLQTFDLWWNGPAFLCKNQTNWPPLFDPPTAKLEDERAVKVLTTQVPYENELLQKYESLHRLLFVTSYALRWWKKTPGDLIPNVQELQNSLRH